MTVRLKQLGTLPHLNEAFTFKKPLQTSGNNVVRFRSRLFLIMV